jgi:hypothetical protein
MEVLTTDTPIRPEPISPFSLSTTVLSSSDVSAATLPEMSDSKEARLSTGVIDASGMVPVAPDTRALYTFSNADVTSGPSPSASILARNGAKSPLGGVPSSYVAMVLWARVAWGFEVQGRGGVGVGLVKVVAAGLRAMAHLTSGWVGDM